MATRPQGAGEGVPAVTGARRGRGQHLRRRGAVALEDPPAAPGRHAEAEADREPARVGHPRAERSGSTRRARRSTTSATRAGPRARSRTSSRSTCAKASHARAAARGSGRSARRAGGRTSARAASDCRASATTVTRPPAAREDLVERSVAVGFKQFAEAAYHALADDDLRERHLAGSLHEVVAADRVLGQADLLEVHSTALEQGLCLPAETAGFGRVDHDFPAVQHAFLSVAMPNQGTFKTEAVVLRSFRLGEADRVLHLYTAASSSKIASSLQRNSDSVMRGARLRMTSSRTRAALARPPRRADPAAARSQRVMRAPVSGVPTPPTCTPAPSAISWALRSSSDVRGSSQVWYLTVTSSDCEISRGSNTIWLRANTPSTCAVGNCAAARQDLDRHHARLLRRHADRAPAARRTGTPCRGRRRRTRRGPTTCRGPSAGTES